MADIDVEGVVNSHGEAGHGEGQLIEVDATPHRPSLAVGKRQSTGGDEPLLTGLLTDGNGKVGVGIAVCGANGEVEVAL